ncbi:MAG: alpha-amylase family glycosyl hydrolase [Bacteroidales bacterium]
MTKILLSLLTLVFAMPACTDRNNDEIVSTSEEIPFTWNNANVYFLLTDRFNNSNPSNDVNFGRMEPTAINRGFQGGDFIGIAQKIEDGYFNDLGVSAIWMTPFHEQIHGLVDEGTGNTYGYHGYWIRDWTVPDPNFGTEEELKKLVETAHKHGIRVLMSLRENTSIMTN